MKKDLLTLLIFFTLNVYSQDWTWMRGSSAGSMVATYGSIGVSAPANNPGGRHGAASWTDANGNLWQFGGEGYASTSTFGWLNDLWKYNPLTNEWTWVRGSNTINQFGQYGTINVSSPTNEPGAREFSMWWKDNNGNFWLFGGEGYDAFGAWGSLNDLWKYDPMTNQWTWVNGSNAISQNGVYGPLTVFLPFNMPGARYGGATWTDNSNNLWLFGGIGFPSAGPVGSLNDLWQYNISTNQWAHMLGTDLIDQIGVYGPKSVALPFNAPGGRVFPSTWKDPAGAMWMFGGSGFSASTYGYLNDLWRFDVASNMWIFESGTNLPNQTANQSTLSIPSITNNPGGRNSAHSTFDNSGNLWLFGGFGTPGTAGFGRLNDVWKYTPSTDEWTWMKGFNGIDQNGIYGTMGVSAPTNNPGGRYYNIGWTDLSGDMWVFGGYGHPATSLLENMNDLWKFKIPSCAPTSVTNSSATNICNGNSAVLSVSTAITNTVTWYSSLTSTVALGTGNSFTTSTLSTGNYTFYAEGTACNVRTPITVFVSACTKLNELGFGNMENVVYPNPNNGAFFIKSNLKVAIFTLYNNLGQVVFNKEIHSENYLETKVPKGNYFYIIEEKGLKVKTGKIVVD